MQCVDLGGGRIIKKALTEELQRVALARALGRLPIDRLGDRLARFRAYAEANLRAWSDRDDAEALRRALIFQLRIAPALQTGVAA